ncbi:MAG: hypothetical protein HC828_16575 [Blastochloris sp.]|nr:hypothetical protein [Blastochloris sp.]
MKQIKQPLFLSLILALSLPLAGLMAETPPAAPGADKPPKKEKTGEHKDRIEQMKTDLGLSDEQVTKIKAIMEEEKGSFKALRDDTTLSKEDKKAKMMELRKSQGDKIKAVLTPEQQVKFEEKMKERGDKLKDKVKEKKANAPTT